MGSLTKSQIIELGQRVKPIIWILRIEGILKVVSKQVLGEREIVSYGSGFSIRDDGTVLTCAHFMSKLSNFKIKARALDEDDFTHDATLLFQRPSWDLVMLKVGDVSGCNFGNLAADGSLFEGETLLHVGNPNEFVGSFLIGHAAYPCVDDVTLPIGGRACSSYDSTALVRTPRYRVMGHIWNVDVFKRFEGKSFVYEKNLHPLVPIIQCAGFNWREGCSGGPVFNTRGEVVGMLVGQSDGYDIAIHVTLLREFFKYGLEGKKLPSLVDPKGKGKGKGEAEIFEKDPTSKVC